MFSESFGKQTPPWRGGGLPHAILVAGGWVLMTGPDRTPFKPPKFNFWIFICPFYRVFFALICSVCFVGVDRVERWDGPWLTDWCNKEVTKLAWYGKMIWYPIYVSVSHRHPSFEAPGLTCVSAEQNWRDDRFWDVVFPCHSGRCRPDCPICHRWWPTQN